MVKNRSAPSRTHGAAALLPALRARIARHELPPGSKLLENELSREVEGGVAAAYRREIEAAPDPVRRVQEIEAELRRFASPILTAEAFARMMNDECRI